MLLCNSFVYVENLFFFDIILICGSIDSIEWIILLIVYYIFYFLYLAFVICIFEIVGYRL